MPISLAIMAVGLGLVYFGVLGFTPRGIRFSPKTTLRGTTGRAVGMVCIVIGFAIALVGLWLVLMIVSRSITAAQ